MTIIRRFSLALEELVELNGEDVSPPARPMPAAPTLSGVLAEIGSLPREALFLGIASDGLPVLLNLHDPNPGPLMVVGDSGTGKTSLLKMIAQAAQQTHHSVDVQFGVITNDPADWEDVPSTDHCVGVFSVHNDNTQEFILSLARWAHANKSKQAFLLLIDDLESLAKLDFETLQNIRWLLLRGPSRRVWPILTLNAERYGQVLSWIPMFRTRIFGRIGDDRVAEALGGDKVSALDQLEPGDQFSLRENGGWIRFWRPGF